jgi:ubiquinone/menaquinone biosynthesis C-methylase UbiE
MSAIPKATIRRHAMPGSHRHPIFARVYPRIAGTAERGGAAEHRQSLLAGLSGRVIEVGAGHGLNFAYYPQTVDEVLAVEPEPHLRELAHEAAEHASISVTIVAGAAEALPAEDHSFDAAVASLVLCSVADRRVALGEISRVLRPGGELRFYEHVISRGQAAARVQRALDATIYPSLAGGCHCARDTDAAIRDAGFEVEREERVAFKPSRLAPAIPHILGVARAR